MGRRVTLLLFFILYSSLFTNAQSRWAKLRDKADSILAERYAKGGYDTAYLSRPRHKITAKVRINVAGNMIKSRGEADGVSYESDLSTELRGTVSLGASYRGLGVSLSLNPGKLSGRNKDFVLNLNYYTRLFSLDVSYQDSKTLHGEFSSGDNTIYLDAGMVRMKVLDIAGFYAFNNRRYSFPAAFTQSYIQKHSVGSWLAGLSYQGGSIKTDGDSDKGIPSLRMYVGNLAIGGGYGYNIVTNNRHWMFHLSAIPMLIVLKKSNVTVNDERRDVEYKFPEMMFHQRLAIVYNINERNFIALSAMFDIYAYRTSATEVMNNKWNSHLCYGIRF